MIPALIAVVAVALALLLAEWVLRTRRPQPDPYAADKVVVRPVNPYLPRGYPAHLDAEIRAHEVPGLPPTGRFTTNAQGLRGPELDPEKRAGRRRIFLVGGSAMECRHLDDALTVSARLQDALLHQRGAGPADVLFAGAWAARSFDHVAALANRVFHLEPDLVILTGGVGEVFAAMGGRSYLLLPSTKQGPRRSWRRLAFLLATETQLARLAYRALRPPPEERPRFEIAAGDPIRWWYHGAPTTPAQRRPLVLDLKSYRENLVSSIGMAMGHQVPIVLATQPSRMTAPRPELGPEPWFWESGAAYRREEVAAALARCNDVTREVAREFGVPLCDLAATFDGADHSYFFDDFHYTAAGADATARALAAFLAKTRLAPPSPPVRAACSPASPADTYSVTQR